MLIAITSKGGFFVHNLSSVGMLYVSADSSSISALMKSGEMAADLNEAGIGVSEGTPLIDTEDLKWTLADFDTHEEAAAMLESLVTAYEQGAKVFRISEN